MRTRVRRAFAVALVAGLAAGCLVEVRHVPDPEPEFARARSQAQARRGTPAHEIRVLTYDPSDQELVSVHVPLWLARKLAASDRDWDDTSQQALGRWHDQLGLDALGRDAGGASIEVEEADGERTLVWLR